MFVLQEMFEKVFMTLMERLTDLQTAINNDPSKHRKLCKGGGGKKKRAFLLSLLKFRAILIVLTLLNPSMTTKLPYHLLMLKKRELNYKNTFVVRK